MLAQPPELLQRNDMLVATTSLFIRGVTSHLHLVDTLAHIYQQLHVAFTTTFALTCVMTGSLGD